VPRSCRSCGHIHGIGVLHCDIQAYNLLLDADLHVKLIDFQGKHVASDGAILPDGLSSEPTRFSYPRDDPHQADAKTDLFALGCTIYFVMMGHAVYPDIVDGSDEWYERVQERFSKQQFPEDLHACSVRVTSTARYYRQLWPGHLNPHIDFLLPASISR
jgi:serine/threonine protein kinase